VTVAKGGQLLRDWLLGVLARQVPSYEQPITDDTSLVEEGLCIDSVGLIELVAAIEKRLGIIIAEDEIQPRHFATVGRLLGFLAGRLGEAGKR
jgi:acyl carrier protein